MNEENAVPHTSLQLLPYWGLVAVLLVSADLETNSFGVR